MVVALATSSDIDPGVTIWIRVHPNLSGLSNAQTARLDALAARALPNVRVIAAESDVDSYALVDAAELVITFGSTIGIEAVYWGAPVMLLGRATYEVTPGLSRPVSLSEAVATVNEPPAPADRDAALAFGTMATESGHAHVRFHSSSPTDPGWFRGRPLTPSAGVRAVVKLRYRMRRVVGRLRRPH